MRLDFISGQYSLYHLEHFFCYLMEGVYLPVELRSKVRLCFYEAVTNAVKHGNHFDDTKKVVVDLKVEDGFLKFFVIDEGIGFRENETCCPLQEDTIEIPHGRGLFLIREYADYMIYHFENRTLEMRFQL